MRSKIGSLIYSDIVMILIFMFDLVFDINLAVSLLDRSRRHRQMKYSFHAISDWMHPELILILGKFVNRSFLERSYRVTMCKQLCILGDMLNTVAWSSRGREVIETFKDIFTVPQDVVIITTVGNHDIGFHHEANRRSKDDLSER